jgi:hypothetical protein
MAVLAKNVDDWSDKLVPVVMHEDGAKTILVHMSSTFIVVTVDRGVSKRQLTNVRRCHKND